MRKILTSPAFMIVVTVTVLFGFTLAKAERQRKTMEFQISTENYEIERLVRAQENFDHVSATAVQLSLQNFQNKTGGNIYAVAMVFDQEGQLATATTAGKNKKRLERLQRQLEEATKNEDGLWRYMAWSGTNNIFKIEYYETYRRNPDGSYSSGSGSTHWPADDDKGSGYFHVFAAEAFPLSNTLFQQLPVYLLVALLLTALILSRKKCLSATSSNSVNGDIIEENSDIHRNDNQTRIDDIVKKMGVPEE